MIEDKTYRLEEMLDSMKQTKENAEQVIDQQGILYDLVEKAEIETDFTEFLKGLKESTEVLESQKEKLKVKIEALDQVINLIESDEKVKEGINQFIVALSLFES